MSTCTCATDGFIDVSCPVAHDEFLPAKCPCGAVWPPGTWDATRYEPCNSCGRVCVTCCECDYNTAPDMPPCAACGHGMPCLELCCVTEHRVTGLAVHVECDAPSQEELANAKADELTALRAQIAREEAEFDAWRQTSRDAQEFLDRHAHLLADIGLDDASLDAAVEQAVALVGPDAMARAADTLSAWHDTPHVLLTDDPHATVMVPSAYPSTAMNRAQRREHDRSVRRNRVGNVRGRR